MSLPQCGICGESIGLTGRCVHQPTPVARQPLNVKAPDDWIDDLLLECADDAADPDTMELTEDDLNIGLPHWILQDAELSPTNPHHFNL